MTSDPKMFPLLVDFVLNCLSAVEYKDVIYWKKGVKYVFSIVDVHKGRSAWTEISHRIFTNWGQLKGHPASGIYDKHEKQRLLSAFNQCPLLRPFVKMKKDRNIKSYQFVEEVWSDLDEIFLRKCGGDKENLSFQDEYDDVLQAASQKGDTSVKTNKIPIEDPMPPTCKTNLFQQKTTIAKRKIKPAYTLYFPDGTIISNVQEISLQLTCASASLFDGPSPESQPALEQSYAENPSISEELIPCTSASSFYGLSAEFPPILQQIDFDIPFNAEEQALAKEIDRDCSNGF